MAEDSCFSWTPFQEEVPTQRVLTEDSFERSFLVSDAAEKRPVELSAQHFTLVLPPDEIWIPADQTIHYGNRPKYFYPKIRLNDKDMLPLPRGTRLVAKVLQAQWSYKGQCFTNVDCFDDSKTIVPFEKGEASFRHLRINKNIKLKKTETFTITSISFEVAHQEPFARAAYKPLFVLTGETKIHIVKHKGSIKLLQKYGLLHNSIRNGSGISEEVGTDQPDDFLNISADTNPPPVPRVVNTTPLANDFGNDFEELLSCGSLKRRHEHVDVPSEECKKQKTGDLWDILQDLATVGSCVAGLRKKVEDITKMQVASQTPGSRVEFPCDTQRFPPQLFVFYAFRTQNMNLVDKLTSAFKFDVNSKDSMGNTVLHIASRNAFLEGIRWCLGNGADVNAVNHLKNTPLHMAYSHNNKEARKILKQHGANKEEVNVFGLVPSDKRNSRKPIAKPNMNPLVQIRLPNVEESFGLSIWFAARIGWIEVVQAYVETLSIDVDVKTKNGQNALMSATEYKQVDVVKYLLERGADPYTRDIHDNTPLHLACMNYSQDPAKAQALIELLEAHGADNSTTNVWNKGPLWYKSAPNAPPPAYRNMLFTNSLHTNSLFRSLA